jgi:acyl-CoA hydrolase
VTVEHEGAAGLDLTRHLRPGDTVTWGQACGEPLSLTRTLASQRASLSGVRCFLGIPCSDTMRPEHADHLRFVSYSGAGANQALLRAGALDLLPCHYSALPSILAAGPLRADAVLLALPPARPDGRHGLGVCADYVAPLIGTARVVIAEVSDQVPDVGCVGSVSRDDLDVVVYTSQEPAQYHAARPLQSAEVAIAELVAGLVEDGATLEIGVGSMPSAALSALSDHRDLGVHSGMITDAVADLIEAGAVTGSRKAIDRGLVVAGFLLGTRRLFGHAVRNRAVHLHPTTYTHDPAVLAAQHRLTAINGAIEVDLTGQINTETIFGRYVGAVGGAADFMRGAARSEGGLAITVLPSTAGQASRIVSRLTSPASIARSDAGVIVTEHGVADLRGLGLAARRERMLAIADPAHRDALAAAELADLFLRGQRLAGMQAVHVPDERRVDVVTEQLLQPLGQLPHGRARNCQQVGLLLPEPARGVLQDHAEPRLVCLVGPAAMPEAAEVEHGRAGGHDRLLYRVIRGGPASWLPGVTAGNEPGGAVLCGEFVQRPHRVDHERRVWLGHRVDRVVAMEDLGGFTWPDANADRSAQLMRAKDAGHNVLQQRVDRGLVERPGLGEQRVHPLGGKPFERVAAGRCRGQDPVEVRARSLHVLAGHHAGDDHVAVCHQPLRDVLAGGRRCGHRRHHQSEPRAGRQ